MNIIIQDQFIMDLAKRSAISFCWNHRPWGFDADDVHSEIRIQYWKNENDIVIHPKDSPERLAAAKRSISIALNKMRDASKHERSCLQPYQVRKAYERGEDIDKAMNRLGNDMEAWYKRGNSDKLKHRYLKLATGTFENCEWSSLAQTIQWNPPAWWSSIEEIEARAFVGMTLGELWEPVMLVLPPARRFGDRIFGGGTPESDQLTVVWGTGPQGTDGISASAFAGCGFNMDVQAYEHTREEVERLANFPWGIADKEAARPAKVFTADPPEGGDHWVVERDPATGKCRLVAP